MDKGHEQSAECRECGDVPNGVHAPTADSSLKLCNAGDERSEHTVMVV